MNVFTDARSIVAQELVRGECLLWYGQPASGIRLRSSDVYLIPFSILWGGFAVFWQYSVVTSNSSPVTVLCGIPFVALGLYLIIGRFLQDASRRASTFYGVTDRRLILIFGSYDRKVHSLPLANLPEMTLSERAGGLGTLTFGKVAQFELIEDAPVVYQIVRDAQKRKSESGRLGKTRDFALC